MSSTAAPSASRAPPTASSPGSEPRAHRSARARPTGIRPETPRRAGAVPGPVPSHRAAAKPARPGDRRPNDQTLPRPRGRPTHPRLNPDFHPHPRAAPRRYDPQAIMSETAGVGLGRVGCVSVARRAGNRVGRLHQHRRRLQPPWRRFPPSGSLQDTVCTCSEPLRCPSRPRTGWARSRRLLRLLGLARIEPCARCCSWAGVVPYGTAPLSVATRVSNHPLVATAQPVPRAPSLGNPVRRVQRNGIALRSAGWGLLLRRTLPAGHRSHDLRAHGLRAPRRLTSGCSRRPTARFNRSVVPF